ncbi:MAG: phage holin family protein [Myxococcales bacterium]|nr:phage holin family protein [Myxococcales bacterium]
MIVHLLISWLVLSLVMLLTAALLPGFRIRGLGGAIVVAALFGILNVALGWLLFVVIGIGTLGLGFLLAFLTRLVVNAILLKLVDAVSDNLSIDGFGWAFIGAACISVLSGLADYLLRML